MFKMNGVYERFIVSGVLLQWLKFVYAVHCSNVRFGHQFAAANNKMFNTPLNPDMLRFMDLVLHMSEMKIY